MGEDQPPVALGEIGGQIGRLDRAEHPAARWPASIRAFRFFARTSTACSATTMRRPPASWPTENAVPSAIVSVPAESTEKGRPGTGANLIARAICDPETSGQTFAAVDSETANTVNPITPFNLRPAIELGPAS